MPPWLDRTPAEEIVHRCAYAPSGTLAGYTMGRTATQLHAQFGDLLKRAPYAECLADYRLHTTRAAQGVVDTSSGCVAQPLAVAEACYMTGYAILKSADL